jgi:heterotetrameric sarcosine oxidase delta subunit
MAFLIHCPNCGPRNPYEFKFGGECKQAPAPDADARAWCDYLYLNENMSGFQHEWWYHTMGCGVWLRIRRNTVTHEIAEEAAS